MPPASQPLALTLALPPATTTSESVILTGYVTGGTGSSVVSWRTAQGSSGLATGASYWSAQVPLVIGSNSIAVTASDEQHTAVSRTVTITRQPGPVAAVNIQLTYPAATGVLTSAEASLNLRGTATHPSGVQSVRWSTASGVSGSASGTTSWETGPIALQAGVNNIALKAAANDGSTGTRTVQVNYASSVHDTTAPSITITAPTSS